MHVIEVYKAEHLGIDISEVLRYMGVRPGNADGNLRALAADAAKIMETHCRGAACIQRLNVTVEDEGVRLGDLYMPGAALRKHLLGCAEAYLFAATVGMEAERAITSAAKLSPARAVALDASGSAAIETFCDVLCDALQSRCAGELRSRFSPGYGDLPIGLQEDILHLLDTHRKIGITLTAGGMLIPTKSVTAIVGIGGENENL